MPDMWIDVDTAVTLPVNKAPLIDDTDFKTREVSIAYNATGMDLVWNFETSAGATSQTAVTPTTGGGDYDWTHSGGGMYKIGIPASGGASINNDTEGYGWFSGICDGVLAWISPVYGFRAAGLNDALCDSAYSATRGLSGTALPNAAADAAGGLPISDAGGLDLDAQVGTKINSILADTGTDGVVVAPASVRSALGLASANLDTQLDALPTAAENRAEMDSNSTQLAAIVADTNELQTDWANGGRLDLIIDAILTDTGTTLDGKLDTIDGIVDQILADTGTDGVAISATVANKIADHVLRRTFANAAASSDGDAKAFRSMLGAMAKLVNKVAISGSTLTVYEADDTTSLGTQAVTTDANADPITAVDTA